MKDLELQDFTCSFSSTILFNLRSRLKTFIKQSDIKEAVLNVVLDLLWVFKKNIQCCEQTKL